MSTIKTIFLITSTLLLSYVSVAQQARIVVFDHELRWTDETKFPNYFLIPEVRNSIFNDTKLELMNYLKVPDIKLPEDVKYKIINGFGKQKVEFPNDISGNDPIIGISSFITRANVGYAIFWKLILVIKQNNKIILGKEVSHELEYSNASGYVTAQQWISPEEFQEIFIGLVREALGVSPSSNEKIVLGSQEAKEEKVRSLLSQPVKHMLKINGAWHSAGNFSALLEAGNDTILNFYFKEVETLSYAKPYLLAPILAGLLAKATGMDVSYEEKVRHEKKGTLFFSDSQNFEIKLKWIAFETRSVPSNDVYTSTQISNPLTAELYGNKQQAGYFIYTRVENVHVTDRTKDNINVFTGHQMENTLGTELIHRIEGSLNTKSITAEYNESLGIIIVKSGEELMAIMVVQNCNPESRSIGRAAVSKNKIFVMSPGQISKKPSLKNEKSVEWYAIYFPASISDESKIQAIETLLCLFFGMGNM
jgi:hypothetical protein